MSTSAQPLAQVLLRTDLHALLRLLEKVELYNYLLYIRPWVLGCAAAGFVVPQAGLLSSCRELRMVSRRDAPLRRYVNERNAARAHRGDGDSVRARAAAAADRRPGVALGEG